MKVIIQDNRRFVIRFDKGEEVFAGLINFAAENNLQAATFTGIGTCSMVEIGYYNPFLKEYRKKPYKENYEVVSLIGNIGTLDSKPVVHAHGSFSGTDFTMIGGHVFQIVSLATMEIHLIKLEGKMERKNHPDYNLNLLA